MKMILALILLLLLEGCQDQQMAANCEQQVFEKGSQYDCSAKQAGLNPKEDGQSRPAPSSRSADQSSRDL